MQMQDFFKDARYKRAYSTISFAFFVFLVEISIYEMLRKFEIKQYWPVSYTHLTLPTTP